MVSLDSPTIKTLKNVGYPGGLSLLKVKSWYSSVPETVVIITAIIRKYKSVHFVDHFRRYKKLE